jgi:saccharopine dehydrogenase (NAD+, L-lysine-forming)
MSRVIIIGAGGVGNVVVKKCAANSDVFTDICIASRNIEKCNSIKNSIKNTNSNITTEQLDADNTREIIQLINKFKPDLVINVALPYQDLTIMDACYETKVNYLDTANYEPKNIAKFEYKWQWEYKDKFKDKGIMALLGSGFDPGVTNVFCAYAQKHFFDEINHIEIIDANAGNHGYPFATNFNPEINIREITQNGRYWENGKWIETAPLSVNKIFNFPEDISNMKIYLLYHEELESLVKNIKGLKSIKFWMTFSDQYINYLNVLKNVGMTSILPIEYEGKKIVPLKFLKAVLPDPGSLGSHTKGKTCIGCVFEGVKNNQPIKKYIYNICEHEKCFEEVQSQAISYTTGVPAMIGATLMLKKIWNGKGVFNMEEFDPDPFMKLLNVHGLPWTEVGL